ncbi:hypothetical protein CYMTET_23724, partial [Cymbomonas tetramitiformis]
MLRVLQVIIFTVTALLAPSEQATSRSASIHTHDAAHDDGNRAPFASSIREISHCLLTQTFAHTLNDCVSKADFTFAVQYCQELLVRKIEPLAPTQRPATAVGDEIRLEGNLPYRIPLFNRSSESLRSEHPQAGHFSHTAGMRRVEQERGSESAHSKERVEAESAHSKERVEAEEPSARTALYRAADIGDAALSSSVVAFVNSAEDGQEGLEEASRTANITTIVISVSLRLQALSMSDISRDLEVVGDCEPELCTLDGEESAGRLFTVVEGASLSLSKLAVVNFNNVDEGGVVYGNMAGGILMSDCLMMNNSAKTSGGVVYVQHSGDVTIVNSNMTQNSVSTSEGEGGVMTGSYSGHITIINSTLASNSAW